VHAVPLLMVPPCINKFYILDLQPENSLVRYAVEQGNTVFLVSWRNPDESLHGVTWDDYVEKGAIKAIEVTRATFPARTRSTCSASASAAPSSPPRWRCWRRAASSRPPA
jgi:poly(3-hydroxyalkanoate) synthetase